MSHRMSTQGVTSSGLLTDATKQLTTLPGALYYVQVDPPTSGIATLSVYDSATGATTNALAVHEVPAGVESGQLALLAPVTVNNGIYVTYTSGTGGTGYIIHYTVG